MELDGEARTVMDFTVPLQFVAHVVQLVAEAIELAANAIAVVAIVQFVIGILETATDAIQLVANVMSAVVARFIVEMMVPLPKAVDIGVQVVVPTSVERRPEREEAGGKGEGEDGSFHMDTGLVWYS
jgi:hypothetical protein